MRYIEKANNGERGCVTEGRNGVARGSGVRTTVGGRSVAACSLPPRGESLPTAPVRRPFSPQRRPPHSWRCSPAAVRLRDGTPERGERQETGVDRFPREIRR